MRRINDIASLRLIIVLALLIVGHCFGSITYYALDNDSTATSDDVFNDPFLALRTKTGGRETAFSFSDAWDNLNEFNCVEWQKTHLEAEPIIAASSSHVTVINTSPYSFLLETNAENAKKCYWQISDIEDFSRVFPNLDEIQTDTHFIILDPINQTFLNPDQTYYLRARLFSSSGWTEWSDTLSFTVSKPQQPENATCKCLGNSEHLLSWDADPIPNTRYLIFGSENSAFIPSIYSEKGLTPLLETDKTSIVVDNSLSYYRIIAVRDNTYSVPSVLIPIVDNITYPYNSAVDKDVWNKLVPYFLPENHPAKKQLDKIFNVKKRVLASIDSLKNAGFRHPKARQWTRLIVTSHPKVPGMIIKLYTDSQHPHRGLPEYTFWTLRIEGVNLIRQAIQDRELQSIFSVPQKWIYPIPKKSSYHGLYPKHFILVEDDMNILDDQANEARWKSPHITTQKLDALFGILQDLGLWDCAKPANIPFCKDGKIAFIDTQTFRTWPVKMSRLTPFLSSEMQTHWTQLMQTRSHR